MSDMILNQIQVSFDKFRGEVDPDVAKDREFTRRKRLEYENCLANRQKIINGILVSLGITLVLGILNLTPMFLKIFKVWTNP